MDNGVRETICTSCVHKDVCAYKKIYLEFLKVHEKLHIEYPDDVSFIKSEDPVCKFNSRKPDVNYR